MEFSSILIIAFIQLYVFVKTQFWVNFTLCKLYFHKPDLNLQTQEKEKDREMLSLYS